MSESTKATIEILEHYHHNGGFYEIPVEVINTVEQELEEQDKEIERLNEKIDTLKIEISSLMSRYFYEEDFYIEDTHLDKLLRIIDNDIVLRGSDKE